MLNPKWYEGMLKHGYEGVRQIEAHVTNTMGWSATTGQVAALGLPAADADLHARPGDARAPRRAQSHRIAPRSPIGCWKRRNAATGQPDEATLEALRHASLEELEDRLEGIHLGAAA